jgi:hypothetical protein
MRLETPDGVENRELSTGWSADWEASATEQQELTLVEDQTN